MRQVVILLIVLLGMWTGLAAGQDTQGVRVHAPAEQTKNAVEVAVEESKKRGEKVVGRCLQDCEENADSANKDVAAQIISLPKPAYPPIARAAHASGAVDVQVLIDFDGTVIAAVALSGHPLLQSASVSAARYARFAPMVVEGEAVKVTGVIRYTFTLDE